MSTDLPADEAEPVHPSDPFCNHFGKLEKRRFNRLFSRVAAIRAADDGTSDNYPDIFEYTHHPITVFRQSQDDYTVSSDPVHESEILDEFDPTRLKNFTVVIEGPVGTGKSELCAYLTHRLRQDRDRPVLRVDKDSDLLTMLTETIPEFYERELGESLDVSGNLQDLAESLESNPEVIAGLVVNKALKSLDRDYDIGVPPEKKDGLEAFTLDKLNELVERRHEDVESIEDEREGFRFVSKQEYESGHVEALHVFMETDLEKDPYELLNDELWAALLEEFDSPPLKELLMRVGQAFDTRPVCVFEDFSIAAVQAEKLRNYMERDNDNDNWDFIIAGTTDFTRELRTQTSEDRFRFYQTNKPESKQVDFLTEDSVIDFIRPYLSYIKTSDDSLQYQSVDGDHRLQDPPAESICGICGLCSNDFRELFPFNETFLKRIYNPGLNEDDRRPRGLIIIVKDILEEVYYGPTTVPSNAQVLKEDVNNPDVLVSDAVLEQNETLANLARWYGEETNQNGTAYYAVNRAFVTAFDIDAIPAPETDPEGTTVADIKYDAKTVYIPSAEDLEVEGEGPVKPGGEDEGGGDEPVETSTVDPATSKYHELRGRVEDWTNDPTSDDYSETRNYMETGIKSLLEYLTDGFSLWTGTDLGFHVGKKRPFVYQNSTETPDPYQIVLNIDSFRASTNRDLLKYGIELEEGSSSPSPEQFFTEEGEATHFSRLAEQWQSKLVDQYVNGDEVLFTKAAQSRDYSFDDFVVAAYAWLVMLDDPWQEITAEMLNERYQNNEAFTLDSGLETTLERLPDDRRNRFSNMMQTAPHIEDILGSRLGVTQNALDVPTLRRHLNRHTPYDVIDNLARNHINRIDRDIRASPDDETKLQEMALRLYDLRQTLDDDIVDLQRSVDESAILAQLRDVSMDEVREIHNTLTQSYAAQMPSELKETLDAFTSSMIQDDIDRVIAGAELIQKLDKNHQHTIHRSLAELKLQEHEIMDYLETLIESGEKGTTSGFAPIFQEVSQYYE